MTEERKASNSMSVLHAMLNRLKSSERLQDLSHVTDQHCRHLEDANQYESEFIPESDKPQWNLATSNSSGYSIKPEGQNDSEYFTQRTVFQDSIPTSSPVLKNAPPSNLCYDLIDDARHDLQPSETSPLWKEATEKQRSQAESHFSIPKNSPTVSSLPHSQPETSVIMECEIIKPPCRTENTVTSVEAEPPPLPPKLWHLNKGDAQLQRAFTLTDFKLDLEPINLLEEICTGEEWAKFLPVKDSPAQTDSKDYSQTVDSHPSNGDIGSQYAVIKPALFADREQPEIGSSPASVPDSQLDRVIQVRQGTSDSPISALPKRPISNVPVTQRTSDVLDYEQFKGDAFDLMVVYVHDKNDPTKVKDIPDVMLPDLSAVKSSGVLDNSALKSRIQLSKKRKHRPPGKRKKGKTIMDFLRQRSSSTESFDSATSSQVSAFASSKFYKLPYSESSDSQTHNVSQMGILSNEKTLLRNAAVLHRLSEVPESYDNDNDFAEVSVLSNKAKKMDVPLDFSAIESSGLLDSSALKNRIQLSKKRKHRPPGKRKNEKAKTKFYTINFMRQRNASTESVQARPLSCPVFTSSGFSDLPRSFDSKDPQMLTPFPGYEKQKAKDRFLKPKLWKSPWAKAPT